MSGAPATGWGERFSHVVTAASFFALAFAYAWTLNVGVLAQWAEPWRLFLVFKIEMFALVTLGFFFFFAATMWKNPRVRPFAVALMLPMLWAGFRIGGWSGVVLLVYLGTMQVLAARSRRFTFMHAGMAHIGGYVYVVLLVKAFTSAQGFDDLTPNNILKPALCYFATRGVLELVQLFWRPARPAQA